MKPIKKFQISNDKACSFINYIIHYHPVVPRPSEVEGSTVSKETETFSETEGTSNVYVKEYVSPLQTDLELKRTFSIAGKSYKIVLIANNMHNQEDNAKMTW